MNGALVQFTIANFLGAGWTNGRCQKIAIVGDFLGLDVFQVLAPGHFAAGVAFILGVPWQRAAAKNVGTCGADKASLKERTAIQVTVALIVCTRWARVVNNLGGLSSVLWCLLNLFGRIAKSTTLFILDSNRCTSIPLWFPLHFDEPSNMFSARIGIGLVIKNGIGTGCGGMTIGQFEDRGWPHFTGTSDI